MIKLSKINEKNFFFICVLSLFIINLAFFFLTRNNSWVSDDFDYIFGSKLYNLVNNTNFFFEISQSRYDPLFLLINQIIPENYLTWHLIVIFFYFLSGVLFYLVLNSLFKNSKFAFFSAILFTLNFSISLKSLSWAIFYSHIFNLFLGLLSLLLLIQIIKKNNLFLIFLYLLICIANVSISEGSLIYAIVNLLFYYFFLRNENNFINNFKNVLLIFVPLIYFMLINLFLFSSPAKILQDRIEIKNKKNYEEIFTKNSNNETYYYRSTYSPRNLKGFAFKLGDNVLNSLNLTILTKNHEVFDISKKNKDFIKKNYLNILIILLIILVLVLFYLLILFKNKNKLKGYKFDLLFYFVILFLYTFIYARTDINLVLSIASAMLISKLSLDLWNLNKKIISSLFIIIFLFPTIIGSFNGFNRFGNFVSEQNISDFKKLEQKTKVKYDSNFFFNNKEMKFYFYFKNFDNYESSFKNNIKVKNFAEFRTFVLKNNF